MIKRQKKNYSQEFKTDAVNLVLEEGYSISEASKNLGISSKNLSRWKQEYQGKLSGNLLSKDERLEIKKLRKENRQLRIEREILKKAAAFFAKENH
jgi:transposase